jgi:hypothetical protein
MSDVELQLPNRASLPIYRGQVEPAVRTQAFLSAAAEYLLLLAIIGCCAAFWIAVIVWIVR